MSAASMLVPLLFIAVVAAGLMRGVDVYDAFACGAAEGLPVLARLLPYLACMLVAVRLLSDSGVFSLLSNALAPVCARLGFDSEIVPLVLVRPFSGSGALALLQDLFSRTGVDSRASYTASILMGSSETIFYELAIYFGAVGARKTRFAAPIAIAGAAASLIAAVALTVLSRQS